MSIDVSQFIRTFLDESFEGLDVMESQLLHLDASDDEAINTIFRAAHSIKGGAGTFGLQAIADFTHGAETLLDEVRNGRREVTAELKSLLLEAGDCIRSMLVSVQDGSEADAARIADVSARIDACIASEATVADPAPSSPGSAAPAAGEPAATQGWKIRFAPDPQVMQSGNDPLRIIAALADLGEVSSHCRLEVLPPLVELDPEECMLSWELELRGDIPREQVDEVFEWVVDECELEISPLGGDAAQDDGAHAREAGSAVELIERIDAPDEAATRQPSASAPPLPAVERRASDTGSIRVGTDKVDALINLVGELVITQSMLGQVGEEVSDVSGSVIERLMDGLAQLERNTRELQESVMKIRMLPISFVFNRFPRLVHDLGAKLGKRIELRLSGEQTEIDKTVMEKIGDPLVHLVRNSVDHGIETPDRREAAGKPPVGTIHLDAYHKGGNIIIEIGDDGAGLNRDRLFQKAVEKGIVAADAEMSDEQVFDLIFAPGFSTAEQLSDISGRGVGMDVVRKNIRALGGAIELRSRPGEGTKFLIRLPLTLAIMDGQLVCVGGEIYIVPLVSIVESLQVQPQAVKRLAERGMVYRLRDEYIPVLFLAELFSGRESPRHLKSGLLVVVESEGQKLAMVVDDLLGQQQVVIKALETNFKRVPGLSGATILGDGTVALILDISSLNGLRGGRREIGSSADSRPESV